MARLRTLAFESLADRIVFTGIPALEGIASAAIEQQAEGEHGVEAESEVEHGAEMEHGAEVENETENEVENETEHGVETETEVEVEWHHHGMPEDVDGDQAVSPVDALAIINSLNQLGAHKLSLGHGVHLYLDVNGDSFLAASDALAVINRLNGVSDLLAQEHDAALQSVVDDHSAADAQTLAALAGIKAANDDPADHDATDDRVTGVDDDPTGDDSLDHDATDDRVTGIDDDSTDDSADDSTSDLTDDHGRRRGKDDSTDLADDSTSSGHGKSKG